MHEHERSYRYHRSQALAEGLLIDVTEAARSLGYRLPVALTATLWEDIKDIPQALHGINNVEGRLWDVLWCGRLAMERHRIIWNRPTLLAYELILPIGSTRLYSVKLLLEHDQGMPVLTLMPADQD